jgi:hypothetical protein
MTAMPPDPALPSEKIIAIPWASVSSPFAVESWDMFVALATGDTTKIEALYGNHIEHSPESGQAP